MAQRLPPWLTASPTLAASTNSSTGSRVEWAAHDVWPSAPVEWTGPNAVSISSARRAKSARVRAWDCGSVRIGTHGLNAGSRSALWGRLSQHRGTSRGTGNHRGSIFRLLVGIALARQNGTDPAPSWGVGSDPGTAARRLGVDRARVKSAEADLEARVSRYIGEMPFLWLDVGDEPGSASQRGLIERNAIALLSGYGERALDPPSVGWLGQFSDRERVRRSGLWNNNHVDEDYASSFLDMLEERIALNGTPKCRNDGRSPT